MRRQVTLGVLQSLHTRIGCLLIGRLCAMLIMMTLSRVPDLVIRQVYYVGCALRSCTCDMMCRLRIVGREDQVGGSCTYSCALQDLQE